MAYEKRGTHARQYYYRVHREGTKVRKIYLGNGPTARQSAQLDADARAERSHIRQRDYEQLAQYDEVAEQVSHFVRQATVISLATLVVAGFHQPAQGSLRRKRHGA